MSETKEDFKSQLRKLELENLRLKAELEARKAGMKTQSALAKVFSKSTTRLVAGARLKRSVKQLVHELPGTPSRDTITDVLVNLVMRLTRIGTFAIMVAAAPLLIMVIQTYILNHQNNKLDRQNELLSRQNNRLDQQINLEEGSRRSSLVFFMSNIMDRMDDELRNNRSRKLSDGLIGRIVSLSQALRPYRYLENDSLTSRQLSPERGQLLFSLINSNLHEETYEKIFERANFRYADLREANFSRANMKGAKLANSFFHKANFDLANLERADLSEAYLEEATFINTKMNLANLSGADLRKSHMEGIRFQKGNLEKADLSEIYLEGDFRGCNLEGIKIQEATLANVDLRGCVFKSMPWLDSLRTFNLKGFASLVEYYEPVQFFENKENFIDTLYHLYLDENSPSIHIVKCNLIVKEIVETSPSVMALWEQLQQDNNILKLYQISSPFGLPEIGITRDSAYVFKLSTSREGTESLEAWLRFDPAQQKLWKTYRGGDSILSKLKFDQKLLENWDSKCAGG